MRFPEDEHGIYAAQLYLQSLYLLATKHGRASCLVEMDHDVPRLVSLYCTGAREPTKNGDACEGLHRIHAGVRRAALHAATGWPTKTDRAEELGEGLLALFREHCVERYPPRMSACGDVAFEAAAAFRAAGRLEKAASAYRELVAYDQRSFLASRASAELGELYESIARFDEAAQWLERFAVGAPVDADAEPALTRAIQLRLALGDTSDVRRLLSTYAKLYGRVRSHEAAALVVTAAERLAARGKREEARAVLADGEQVVTRAPADVRARAHVIRARTYLAEPGIPEGVSLQARAAAAEEYAKARHLLRDVERDERSSSGAEDLGTESLAEAIFFAAETKRLAELPPRSPQPYVGPPQDRKAILRYVDLVVKGFIADRKPRIERVEDVYARIPRSSRFRVIGVSRVAEMWVALLRDGERAIPEGAPYETNAALREYLLPGYVRPRLDTCLASGTLPAAPQEYVARCDRLRARLYRTLPSVDEIFPAPREYGAAPALPLR